MQDNELDKLINDAASQHHPPYDDEAWGKMRALLDKHLPEEKDRRRPFILWSLLLLLGGAITLGILQPWNDDQQPVAAVDKTSEQDNKNTVTGNAAATQQQTESTGANATATTDGNSGVPATNASLQQGAAVQTTSTITQPATAPVKTIPQQTAIAGSDNNRRGLHTKGKSSIKVRRPSAVNDSDEDNTATAFKEKKPLTVSNNQPTALDNTVSNTSGDAGTATEPTTVSPVNTKTETPAQKTDSVIKNQTTPAGTAAKKDKKDNRFVSNFMLTVSAGADRSFTDWSNPGQVKTAYGAGIAYNIGKHIRVGAGFYAAKKVYDAAPSQYKFPNGATYPNLQGINADCNVYEIPVSLHYSFGQQKNHSWFAGAALSSLLMKKEHYNYQYKTPAGMWYSYSRTVNNENKHYFSVLTISGGYQYKLSGRVMLIGEPYLKLPLAGVGAGKIKLSSTGLMVTAAVKPFARSKK